MFVTFFGDIQTSNDIIVWAHVSVHIFKRTISDEPAKSLGIKTHYTSRNVRWIYVGVFHMIGWSKMNANLHEVDSNGMLLDESVSTIFICPFGIL